MYGTTRCFGEKAPLWTSKKASPDHVTFWKHDFLTFKRRFFWNGAFWVYVDIGIEFYELSASQKYILDSVRVILGNLGEALAPTQRMEKLTFLEQFTWSGEKFQKTWKKRISCAISIYSRFFSRIAMHLIFFSCESWRSILFESGEPLSIQPIGALYGA